MEASTDLFINIIRNHRIIYDTKSKDFKNIHKKEDEWVLIAAESRMTVDAAKKRYSSLRQKYSREKKKEIICYRTKDTFRPSVFFHRLNFLEDFIKPRRTYTNDVEGMDIQDNDGLDDDNNQRLIANGYATYFGDGDGYSLAQEEAEDRAILAEMQREGLLPAENEPDTLGGGEVGEMDVPDAGAGPYETLNEYDGQLSQAEAISQSPAGNSQFDLDLNSEEMDELLACRPLNSRNTDPTAIQSVDLTGNDRVYLSDTRQQQQSKRSAFMDTLADDRNTRAVSLTNMTNSQVPTETQQSSRPSDNNQNMNIGHSSRQISVLEDLRISLEGRHGPSDLRRSDAPLNTINRPLPHMNNTASQMSVGIQQSSSRLENCSVNSQRDGLSGRDRSEASALAINRNQSKGGATSSVLTRNSHQSTSRVTSSVLSKNSPVVQAVASARQQEKASRGTNSNASMDAIKEKMESYLKACNDKLLKKQDRSPHARFLSYLGTKMENVPQEQIEKLEQDILAVVFRYTRQN